MKLKDAIKLHNEDEVTVKQTGAVMRVIETEIMPKDVPLKRVAYVDILLEDGNWYSHKEIN